MHDIASIRAADPELSYYEARWIRDTYDVSTDDKLREAVEAFLARESETNLEAV